MNSSLATTTNATSMGSNIAASSPVSVYFMSFLNYFTMCSLYALLNFPIPQHIYEYFANVYEQLNSSIFSLFGIEVKLQPFSDEKVSRKRAVHFDISSDVLSNTYGFVFLIANFALIFFLQWFSSFLKKTNKLR